MLITRRSIISGKINTLNLSVTDDQIKRLEQGFELIQDIFPDLEADEREFIKSGITPGEWEEEFKK